MILQSFSAGDEYYYDTASEDDGDDNCDDDYGEDGDYAYDDYEYTHANQLT